MSNTRQDKASTKSESTSGGEALPVPQPKIASESTLAERKHGRSLAPTSEIQKFDQARNELCKEMNCRWVGAMPLDLFFEKFLPHPNVPMPHVPNDAFDCVPIDRAGSAVYTKFIDVIQEWTPSLHAINTSNREHTANLETDISFYKRTDYVEPLERMEFSTMELWIVFKTKTQGVAFEDPPEFENSAEVAEAYYLIAEKGSFTPATVEGMTTRGQLAQYAEAQHRLQFRHFSFSMLIEGDRARFLRWDPAGTVVTIGFDYRKKPELMAEFLWRFNHLSAEQRGHDGSVESANLLPDEDARVREKLGIKDNSVPLYRYTLHGLKGYAYGPRPATQYRSLVRRCTRSLPLVWIPHVQANSSSEPSANPEPSDEQDTHPEGKDGPWTGERLIYMKDTWRYLSSSVDVRVKPEHEIYEILHAHKTPNIPKHVAGSDVPGGKTRTQEFRGAEWVCVEPTISPFQHYRLLHGVVGRALSEFSCTKQLVTAVFHALEAHAHTYQNAKLLHRDISLGNIILTDEGKGLLIDWEMAKEVDQIKKMRPDRAGTWPFMSANLLQNPDKMHTLADDLESFLHVLAWMTLHYVPAVDSYPAFRRRRDLVMFDEYGMDGFWMMGGYSKSIVLGSGSYPSRTFRPRTNTPLLKLIQTLSIPFGSLYRSRINLDSDNSDDSNDSSDSDSDRDETLRIASMERRRYERDMQRLQDSSWFMGIMEKALDNKVWPTDDKADETLLVARLPHKKEIQGTSQLKDNHDRGMSNGTSRNLKRRASPTPESSSKRCRVAPASELDF